MPKASRALLAVLVGAGLLFGAGCGEDGDALPPAPDPTSTTTADPSTSTSSTTTTTAAPSTTVAADDRCADDPGPIENSPLTTPSDANLQCDARAGWRMFFWIGESGDPIYRVQRVEQDDWVDVDHDVACQLDESLLASKGVPSHLAGPWGERFGGQCG